MGNCIKQGDEVIFHPGYYIEELISEGHITYEELEKNLCISSEEVVSLLDGKINLSKEMGYRLSEITGTSEMYWWNIQEEFDKQSAKCGNKKENWFLLGDIHGSANPILDFYNKNKERLSLDESNNYILLLGDVACNFALKGRRDYKFKTELAKLPFIYICLRGNHEARVMKVIDSNPEGWNIVFKYGGKIYVEKEFPTIEYLSDSPAEYEFAGYKTLVFPGAYSVDKWYRISKHWTWYEDEQLNEKEMELGRNLVKNGTHFDLVLSHTCPMIYEPRDLFLWGIDQSLVDKSMERYLGEIEYSLDYDRWAFGHFHSNRLYPWNDGKQMLILFNENVVDLVKFMEMKEGDSLQEIFA